MSLSIAGSLNVIERNGRNGTFTVGELTTEIGTFAIKSRVLDEFTEGSYSGVFLITRIFNQSNVSGNGRVWVSLCADLDWAALKIMAQSDEADVSETLNISSMMDQTVEETKPPAQIQQTQTSAPVHADRDAELVIDTGTLAQLIESGESCVKLDATLENRDLFRELRNMLKDNGYRFDATSQSWHLPYAA